MQFLHISRTDMHLLPISVSVYKKQKLFRLKFSRERVKNKDNSYKNEGCFFVYIKYMQNLSTHFSLVGQSSLSYLWLLSNSNWGWLCFPSVTITTTITTLTKIKRGKKVNSVEFDVAGAAGPLSTLNSSHQTPAKDPKDPHD